MTMPNAARQVFNAIRNGARSGNKISISYQEIADTCGLQVTMVSSCIRLLVDRKYLERKNNCSADGKAKKNSYKVLRIPEEI